MRAVLLAEMADALTDAAADGAGAPVVLAVTATGREAEDLTAALASYLPRSPWPLSPPAGRPSA